MAELLDLVGGTGDGDADHEAAAPSLLDQGVLPGADARRGCARPCEATASRKPGFPSSPSTTRAAAAASGLPPKVEPWSPLPRTWRRLAAREDGADGHAAGEALGEGDDVGLDA